MSSPHSPQNGNFRHIYETSAVLLPPVRPARLPEVVRLILHVEPYKIDKHTHKHKCGKHQHTNDYRLQHILVNYTAGICPPPVRQSHPSRRESCHSLHGGKARRPPSAASAPVPPHHPHENTPHTKAPPPD